MNKTKNNDSLKEKTKTTAKKATQKVKQTAKKGKKKTDEIRQSLPLQKRNIAGGIMTIKKNEFTRIRSSSQRIIHSKASSYALSSLNLT
ncbi:12202_t:CDS:2 [Entrophospora sp. SA101]|nr:12202_t:CDS:2 [Entrophospora sp. SA101]